jgi:hypothetical protein
MTERIVAAFVPLVDCAVDVHTPFADVHAL